MILKEKNIYIYICFFLIISLNGKSNFLIRDNVVFDSETKTSWIIKDSKLLNYKKSKKFCKNLKIPTYYYCKLPSISLLLSLVNYEIDKPFVKTPFLKITDDLYWSSTKYVQNKKQAWIVDFKTRKIKFRSIKKKLKVLCVCQ